MGHTSKDNTQSQQTDACHPELKSKTQIDVIRFMKGNVIRHGCPASMNSRTSEISMRGKWQGCQHRGSNISTFRAK